MNTIPVIALDGPGGVGKGTVGRALAERLAWHYLDSGALYRVAAYAALTRGLEAAHPEPIAALIPDLDIACIGETIRLDGEDVSREIREEEVGRLASAIAPSGAVRAALMNRQRAFRRAPGLVADGRDMGTVVFPDAILKVFLTASAEERTRRRYKQLKEQGIDVKLSGLHRELGERDERDAGRAIAPLKPAPEAVVVDTTAQSAAAVVERVLGLAREALGD
ncbi:MAG: (d)CMP kinase [Gammaproteobacteria bacterium]